MTAIDTVQDNRPDSGVEIVPLRHWGRIAGAAVVIAFILLVLYTVGSSQNVRWNVVPPYLLTVAILNGVLTTLKLTVLSMLFGIALGTVLAVMRMSPDPVLRTVSSGYIWFFRGTPLLVQIFFWFNIALFVPRLSLPGWSASTNDLITSTTAALLALSLHEAANMAEIVRGGILSVETGQLEASLALGLRRGQAMRRIILPQAIRVIIPPTGNQAIGMLKATAMVSVIGAHELLTNAQNIYARNFLVIELLIVATIWYLFLTTLASIGQHYLERHFTRGVVAS
ncbi:amino acid ABC transporter permease [Kribbella sp. WER1]